MLSTENVECINIKMFKEGNRICPFHNPEKTLMNILVSCICVCFPNMIESMLNTKFKSWSFHLMLYLVRTFSVH